MQEGESRGLHHRPPPPSPPPHPHVSRDGYHRTDHSGEVRTLGNIYLPTSSVTVIDHSGEVRTLSNIYLPTSSVTGIDHSGEVRTLDNIYLSTSTVTVSGMGLFLSFFGIALLSFWFVLLCFKVGFFFFDRVNICMRT